MYRLKLILASMLFRIKFKKTIDKNDPYTY